jgi:hypothetical protein
MRLEAHLTTADFEHAFAQLTPLRVSLDPDSPQRQLSLKPPSEITLLPGLGLRIVTELQLQWDVIGVRVPVTLRRVVVLLTPSVVLDAEQPALAFGLQIDEADLSAIPDFLGEVLVGRVNEALKRPEARVAWRFTDTLDFDFPLPKELAPQRRMRVHARAGEVHVEAGRLRLIVDWGLAAYAEPEAT